jgi:hypothetical protein
MANAGIDQNSRATLTALSSTGDGSIVTLYANPTTHRLLVDLAGGSGTVTSVSVVSANGFAGTVATPTTTPAITLTTTITGILKGNGTAISAATVGTDYSVGTSALATGILKSTTTTGALTIAVAGDFPTLNQNTTGSAATLTTTRTIWGQNFNGSANVTGDLALGVSNLTLTGSVGATGARATKVWTAALEVTTLSALTVGGTAILTSLTAPQFTTIELGAASDTTLSRVAAGVIAVEGETLNGYATTATAAGTTTLTIASFRTQFFTGSTTQTCVLPTTSVIVGQAYRIVNNSTGNVTVQSSGANTIQILGAGMSAWFTAIVATPTTAANWSCALQSSTGENIAQTASANAATVNLAYITNTITNNSAATLTITMPTAGAIDGERRIVRVYDFSAVAQTITWVNTQNSTATATATSNGSTTLPVTIGFQYNSASSLWRCIAAA